MVAIAVIAVFLLLLAGGFLPSGGSGRFYGGGWFFGFFLILPLLWLSFFAVRVYFWRHRARAGGPRGPGTLRDPAVATARARYARGEISREQFDQILTDLGRR